VIVSEAESTITGPSIISETYLSLPNMTEHIV
jgi:hypothetical protein